jgi:hypothetical protein
MTPLSNENKETLRIATLEALVAYHPAALSAKQLHRRVVASVDFQPALEDVDAALEFLKSDSRVEVIPDEFGSTKYFRATAGGVRTIERR